VNDGRRRVGLLTLGSAAVLTIYSAGFVRTRAAANRVADAEAARHPSAEHRRAAPDSPTVPSVLGPASSARAAVDSVAVPMLRAPARASATPGGSTATAPARGNADSANIVVAQSVEATSPPPATTESAPEPVAPLAEEQPQPVPPPQPSQEQYKGSVAMPDGERRGTATSRPPSRSRPGESCPPRSRNAGGDTRARASLHSRRRCSQSRAQKWTTSRVPRRARTRTTTPSSRR